MVEYNSHKTINIYPSLNDQQFRLNKTNEVRDYFAGEVKERWLISKRLGNYVAFFDDNSLIVLSVTTGSTSTASFATVIGAPVWIASVGFSLALSISTTIVKKLLKATKNKTKKHNKIVMLARSKWNSIES